MKRAIFTLLVIAACSIPSFAKYSGGSGDANTPYQIANAADLMTLANDANDYNKCFIMTADINLDPCLTGGQVFTTAVIARGKIDRTGYNFIGNAFTGVFDGAGHKIINLTIDANVNSNDFLGLFGDVNGGGIKNLGLEDVKIIGNRNSSTLCGGLAGRLDKGVISNCYSSGNVTTGANSWLVGGLIGEIGQSGSISNSHSTCNVAGADYSSELGGLAGRNLGTINNCFSKGTVASDEAIYDSGGFVGANGGYINNSFSTVNVGCGDGSFGIGCLAGYSFGGAIIDCFSTGSITGIGSTEGFGGFIGHFESGSISSCYSTGAVTGGNYSVNFGGFAGTLGEIPYANISNSYSTGDVNVGNESSSLGGFIGQICNGDVSNCYSTGDVNCTSGPHGMAGFVGYKQNGNISGSFYLVNTGPYNGYGVPLSDSQMKHQASFVGWDFATIWRMRCEGMNYPRLRWSIPADDFVCPDGINFVDYAFFASRWLNSNCAANNNCNGTDLNGSGIVDLADLASFAGNWLKGL